MALYPLGEERIAGTVPLSHWAERYLGIPFVEHGFDETGCHCWGLVCFVFRNEFRIDLPRHDTITAKQLLAAAKAYRGMFTIAPYREVDIADARNFDIVLMSALVQGGRIEGHVGLWAGPRSILHVERNINAVCVPASHPMVRRRILKILRHGDVPTK